MKEFKKKIAKNWTLFKIAIFGEKEYLYNHSLYNFKRRFMDPTFEWKKYKGLINPYFAKWGFKFPLVESAYYSKVSGIDAYHYLPFTLYSRYIFSYLNKQAWYWGYADKNMFHRFLDIKQAQNDIDILMPICIGCCSNGRFFLGNDIPCSFDELLNRVVEYDEDIIIKPTIESSHGTGVIMIKVVEKTKNMVFDILSKYSSDYTIQKKIEQHPSLAIFNESSVNTIRITTYQDFNGNVKIINSSQRWGGKGKVFDNADSGSDGGFCGINDDGSYKREIHKIRHIETYPMPEYFPISVPSYDKIKDAVLHLHHRFPQFALIGWDMTVDKNGHPVVVEYNFRPGLTSSQCANGPLFSEEDLDEIMNHIVKRNLSLKITSKLTFDDKKNFGILPNEF